MNETESSPSSLPETLFPAFAPGNDQRRKHLWYDFLKKLPYPVKRQHIIGPYIVDFYIAAFFLIIELDGSQHGDEEQFQADIDRDMWLTNEGYRVVRYPNSYLHDHFEDVCNDIWSYLEG